MTDITELAQSLKAAADNAGADYWQAKKISGDFYVIRKGSYKRECGYTTYQPIAEIDHKPTRDYVAMANPANVLALVEALEKAQTKAIAQGRTACELFDEVTALRQRIAELESRTVKLPEPEQWDITQVLLCKKKVVAAIRAAGIKVEAE